MNKYLIVSLFSLFPFYSVATGELNSDTQITCRDIENYPNYLICDNDKVYEKKILNLNAFHSNSFTLKNEIIDSHGKNYLSVTIPRNDGKTSRNRSSGAEVSGNE